MIKTCQTPQNVQMTRKRLEYYNYTFRQTFITEGVTLQGHEHLSRYVPRIIKT